MNIGPLMVKRGWIFSSIAISCVSLFLALFFFISKETIVYVDSVKLFSQYKGTLQAKAAYEKKMTVYKANIDTLTEEVNKEIKRYQRDLGSMSVKEKKLSEELIRAKQQQLESYKSAISESAAKEDEAITAQVVQEINGFLKTYGEDQGYSYILGATNMGNVIYAKKGKDITEEVLVKLNAGPPALKK